MQLYPQPATFERIASLLRWSRRSPVQRETNRRRCRFSRAGTLWNSPQPAPSPSAMEIGAVAPGLRFLCSYLEETKKSVIGILSGWGLYRGLLGDQGKVI